MRVSFLGLICLLAACGANSPGGGGGGAGGGSGGGSGGGMVAPAGELTLEVAHARRASSGPLELFITLANGSGAPAEPLNPALFQISTGDGLLHAATLATPQWIDGSNCDATVSLTAGHSTSCDLEFDLPSGAAPVSLIYSTPDTLTGIGADQRTATASLTVEACSACGSACTYLDRDPDNCGHCGSGIGESGNSTVVCRGGAVACADPTLTACADPSTAGETWCWDLQSDPANCGACGAALQGGLCQGGHPSCPAGTTQCPANGNVSASCSDLQTDRENCGSCGAVVSGPRTCIDGQPACAQATQTYCPAVAAQVNSITTLNLREECANLSSGGAQQTTSQGIESQTYWRCGACETLLEKSNSSGGSISCVQGAPQCAANQGDTLYSATYGATTIDSCD